jgi:CRISPR-associated protein Csm2
MTRSSSHPPRSQEQPRDQSAKPLFDPTRPESELFDTLAETQAEQLEKINSSQLRRFFGEIKDLYRRFNALTAGKNDQEKKDIYRTHIEPLFKMVRSKVSYATRAGQSKVPRSFAEFLEGGIAKVQNHEDYRRFVLHLEAVVGFMYGKGKVENR